MKAGWRTCKNGAVVGVDPKGFLAAHVQEVVATHQHAVHVGLLPHLQGLQVIYLRTQLHLYKQHDKVPQTKITSFTHTPQTDHPEKVGFHFSSLTKR